VQRQVNHLAARRPGAQGGWRVRENRRSG
jgi:hypothetical protein